ncbi:MAG: beta-hexosaminidase [Eubacterium sp.]|nr:beta-hexosaminidase [Eubacterium sp.]
MKKHIKALLCIVLALSLLIASGSVAFAEEEKTVDERVEEILKGMTLKEKIAQMILYDLPSNPKDTQEEYQFGGYLLFADAFKNETPAGIKKKIKKWQRVSKVKMLIAVDEEGGYINRVSKYSQFRKEPFPSPSSLRKHGGIKAVKKDSAEKAALLKELGINTDLAPVADTPYNASNYIHYRAYSVDADKNSKFVSAVITEFNNNNLIGCLKHFPGYGGNGNTHTDIIRDKRSLKTFKTRDLKPFKAGIKAGAGMILVNHDIVKAFDKNNPASISKKVHSYLREELGYEGVIMTDSLNMAAARDFVGNDKKLAVKAVKAGNDMLCTGYGKTAIKSIYEAVKSGKISEKRINRSVRRILKMKIQYGIIK